MLLILAHIYPQNSTYRLYAVVVHYGTSANTGHYFTYVKYRDTWYKMNDDTVCLVKVKNHDPPPCGAKNNAA